MTPDPSEEAGKLRAALLRAMPVTRMLDYGMDHWDAMTLSQAPAESPWDQVAVTLADQQLQRAERAERQGDHETAVACYRRGTAALVFAQMAFNQDTATKRDLYGRLGTAYESAARLDRTLRVTRLRVPHAGSSCHAWMVRPVHAPDVGAAVLVVGGQSGWGPAFHRQAEALAHRGLTVVLLELPGQGETRMVHGLHLDGDVGEAFSAAFDAVRDAAGVERFGTWGNSLGGLLAARAALHDPRVSACCVNGAPSRPEPAPYRTAREQSQAMLGVSTDEEVGAVFRRLWVDPTVHRTDASMLVLHGERDPLVTLQDQEPFLAISEDATLRVWDDGEHTVYNHSAERTDLVADWFRSRLECDR